MPGETIDGLIATLRRLVARMRGQSIEATPSDSVITWEETPQVLAEVVCTYNVAMSAELREPATIAGLAQILHPQLP